MKPIALSTKIFLASGLTLVLLSLASFAILYRAQTQLAVQEMDSVLDNQAIALSALVSAKPGGKFDFEMSPLFLTRYKRLQPSSFFRFTDPIDGKILRESPDAPELKCPKQKQGGPNVTLKYGNNLYRLKISNFLPEIDSDLKNAPVFEPAPICLITGIDEAPYRSHVMKTLFSTIPLLIAMVGFLIGILLILVRRITRDLSQLTGALETANFTATREFPVLPETQTLEVKAVVEKLAGLHSQAADVYREMWLFLGRAAHQLKTPVAAIQATLQVLLRKERSKEELIAGLADVEIATAQLASLTKKLISSSRISYQESSLRREPIDLGAFIPDQLKMFRTQAEQYGITLHVKSTSSLKVSANSFLLSEILGNLIENAILYSPREKNATVSISWEKELRNAVILISDQGTGFPDQVKQALFKPFIRGDERQIAGSGLGLSIAKKSAQLLGGDIVLRQTNSEGSKIAVTFPILS